MIVTQRGRRLRTCTFGARNLRWNRGKRSNAAKQMTTIASVKRGPPVALPPGMAERAVRETLNLTRSSKMITMGCRCFYDPG